MPTIYTAKYLLPANAPLIEGGALLDLDGRIVEIGSLAEVRRGNAGVEVVDFGAALLLPPLVNAHTHLELSDYPRWAGQHGELPEVESFVDWILQVIRIKHALPQENYLPSLDHGIELSLAAGTGAVGDIISHRAARRAYQDCPLRGKLYLETLGQDAQFIRQSQAEIDAVLRETSAGELQLGLSPHSPYTTSADYLAQLFSRCRDENLACTTHVAESREEVLFLAEQGGEIAGKLYPFVGWQDHLGKAPGQRPIEYLQRQGGLQPNNLLVHAVQLNSGEISKIAEAGCAVALCPRSNARLDVGVAPVKAMLQAGIRLALGTDSLASCDSLSVWDELAFAADWFAGQVDAPTLLQMATGNGAAALGLAGELGLLQTGYRSSFQVLQPQSLPDPGELYDFLVAPGRTEEVAQLYLDGTPVLP